MITQSDYAVVSKEDNKIKRFCMVKEGDDVPTEEGFIYVKVSQEVREFIYEDESDPTSEKSLKIWPEQFDPDAELGSIYFKSINKFAPNIEGIDYEEFYVFNTISKVWIPPQMSNDKVTHIWSNFEQNFIPI
jgi:hypothetical protein